MDFLEFPIAAVGHTYNFPDLSVSPNRIRSWREATLPADPERAARWAAMKTAWVQTQKEESERKKPTVDLPPHN